MIEMEPNSPKTKPVLSIKSYLSPLQWTIANLSENELCICFCPFIYFQIEKNYLLTY